MMQFARFLVRHLPLFVVREPERVLVAVSAILIGITVFWPPSRSATLQQIYPDWVILEWGVTLLTGGFMKLIGLWMSSHVLFGKTKAYELRARLAERAGASLICFGAATYGITLIIVSGWSAIGPALIFLCLAAANGIRFIVSAVGRAILDGVGDEE
jgi:hypothetical protein